MSSDTQAIQVPGIVSAEADTGTTPTTFNDFYFRPNLSATNTIPAPGPYTTCPDIIPSGTTPIPDFANALATSTSYATSYGNQILEGFDNYLYVRGANGNSAAVTRQVSLYYAPSGVIQWPSQWVQNAILTASGASTVQVQNVAPAAVAVAPDTFIWRQVQPPPAGSDHYCLFSYSTDPANPVPIPGSTSPMTYEDMGTIIQTQLNIGWLNTVLVDTGAPNWTYNQMLTVPTSVGVAKTVHVYVSCVGYNGAQVSFTGSTQDGASGPVSIPQTTISSDNYLVGTTVTLQPGFAASITVNFWIGSAQPQSGASISLEAAYDTPGDDVEAVQRQHAAGLVRPEYVRALQAADGITPSTPVYLGRMKFQAQ